MVKASRAFVPVFVDTLDSSKPYKRFGERWGSYPVLRIFDPRRTQGLDGLDLANRLDGNKVAGRLKVADMLAQFERGLAAYAER